MTSASRRNAEAGYALLFVYMMAACVAVMLYTQIPRVAFEAQREKEQLLIDRGEQYERGIQLYFRKFHTYPPTLDALDKTQNIRFIRRRYADPMTGKQDWRLIHVGAGGVLTDSILNKGKSLAPAAAEKQTFVSEVGLVGATNTTDPNQAVNLATRRRPSDTPGTPGSPSGPPVTSDPNNPGPVVNGATNGMPGQQIQPANGAPYPVPGQQFQGANGATVVLPDGRVIPAVNGVPGGTGQMQPGQQQGQLQGQLQGQQPAAISPYGAAAQSNPYAQPSMPGQPGAAPTAAVNLINQLLTTPRQGGLNGTQGQVGNPTSPFGAQQSVGQGIGTQTGTAQGGVTQPGASPFGAATSNTGTPITGTTGQTIGAGIAGVATKAEGDAIKIYNQRTVYKEWEFIYDLSKDTSTGGRVQQGQLPQQQNGINGVNGANGIGGAMNSSGIGSSSGNSAIGSSTVGSSTSQSTPTGQYGAPTTPLQPPPAPPQ